MINKFGGNGKWFRTPFRYANRKVYGTKTPKEEFPTAIKRKTINRRSLVSKHLLENYLNIHFLADLKQNSNKATASAVST